MDFSDAGPTTEELHGVKDFIASFFIGVKNFCLYPENHSICRKSVENAATRLKDFLKDFQDLRLDVERERLVFKNQVVFQEPTGAENMATILFRDGIQWVQFSEGFGLEGLRDFFRILKNNKNWNEDSDGDIVTALWEANLSNFKYMAVDVYWESEPLIDYSLINAKTTEDPTRAKPDVPQTSLPVNLITESDDSLWKLTEEEEGILSKMLSEEEQRDSLNDLLFVVFVLLNDREKNNDLKTALEFMEDELQQSLTQGDFKSAYRLIRGLWRMRDGVQNKKSWATDDLDQFFFRISSPKALSVVPSNLRSIDALNSEDLKLLNQFFLLLHPNAIYSLGPLLGETHSLNARQQILQLISALAERDFRPLEGLIKKADDIVVKRLVPVLGLLQGERPFKLLQKLLKHQSVGVRKQAIKQFKDLNDEVIKWLFILAEDPDESIRNMVLRKIGKDRNLVAEDLLLNYLEKRQYTITNHQHLLACYLALGRCGSYHCIPFLQKSLFTRGWLPDLGKSVHRVGATVALLALETKEAEGILQKASRSFLPAVRLAYKKALEISR